MNTTNAKLGRRREEYNSVYPCESAIQDDCLWGSQEREIRIFIHPELIDMDRYFSQCYRVCNYSLQRELNAMIPTPFSGWKQGQSTSWALRIAHLHLVRL
jgi:hypothetical protein